MFGEVATKGALFMLVSALLQGSHGLWANLIGLQFGVFYQGWTRSVIVLAILVPLVFLTRSLARVHGNDYKWYALFIGFMILSQAPIFYAYNTIGISSTALLFMSAWLATNYLLGLFVLGEELTITKLISFVLAISGLLIVFSLSLSSIFGMAMAIMAGVVSAAEVAFTKKVTHRYSTLQVTTAMWLGIFLTHLPFALLAGEPIVPPSLSIEWLYHVGYACSIMLAFWLAIKSFKHIDASIGGLVCLMMVVFAAIFGAFVLQEPITLAVVVGGSLITLASVLPIISMRFIRYGTSRSFG